MENSPDRRLFVWEIDHRDHLISVNDNWLAFARENEAPGLSREFVLERPLWDFISGHETSHLYKLIFEKTRAQGSTITLPFRCDSPDRRRFMEMVILPLPDDAIRFASRLLKQEFRDLLKILDSSTERSEEFLRICSWCKKIYLPTHGWRELEEAIRVLDLFGEEKLPQLTHGICDVCQAWVGKNLI